MLLLRSGPLAGANLLRAMVTFELPRPPEPGGIPVLILAGRQDEMMTTGQPQRLAALLLRAGANVTLDWQETGRGLGARDVKKAKEWMGANFAPQYRPQKSRRDIAIHPGRKRRYSTVTLLARLRGLSTSQPRCTAMW